MRYYRLLDDINYPDRWYLGEIEGPGSNWQFTDGMKLDQASVKDLKLSVYQAGKPMYYTITEGYGVPIVSEKIRRQLEGFPRIQFIPVNIFGEDVDMNYYIMVVITKLDCVNEELSVFGKFEENDLVGPDLVGQYSWFTKLIVDPNKRNKEEIFRINKAENYLVVSERIRHAF
jgi:hypothetical protein